MPYPSWLVIDNINYIANLFLVICNPELGDGKIECYGKLSCDEFKAEGEVEISKSGNILFKTSFDKIDLLQINSGSMNTIRIKSSDYPIYFKCELFNFNKSHIHSKFLNRDLSVVMHKCRATSDISILMNDLTSSGIYAYLECLVDGDNNNILDLYLNK